MDRDMRNTALINNIRSAMDRAGINASELASRAGVGKSNIYDILLGRSKNPRLTTLEAIANALGLPITDLVTPPTARNIQEEILQVAGMLSEADQHTLLRIARAIQAEKAHNETRTPEPG